MTARRIVLGVLVAMLAAACGGGGGDLEGTTPPGGTSPTPTAGEPECSPHGIELHVVAKSNKFSETCLAAPADTAFSIHFENRDAGIPHNIVIENDDKLFEGEIFEGMRAEVYDVSALPAGTYTFYCEVHPGPMQGTFVVE